jgi:hypothetical protein
MTWVFGTPIAFIGMALCVADIQVTLRDERRLDCLQKLYPMHQNVLAGFSGDVQIGFSLLEALARDLPAYPSNEPPAVAVSELINGFPQRARDVFNSAPALNRSQGSALLIAGATPAPSTIYGGKPEVACLRGPEFIPEPVDRGEWGSIGSGAAVGVYRQKLEAYTSDAAHEAFTMEGGWVGGFATVIFTGLMSELRDLPPVPGISEHFHACLVTASGWEGRSTDRTEVPATGHPRKVEMPKVATSWAELQAVLAKAEVGSPILARA